MAGVIVFSRNPDIDWFRAGWIFRQVMEDTLAQCPTDAEMSAEFERAEAIGALFVDEMREPLRSRTRAAMRDAAIGILKGEVRSRLEDKTYETPVSIEQYRESLEELLAAIERAC